MQAVLPMGCSYILKCVDYFVSLKGDFYFGVLCAYVLFLGYSRAFPYVSISISYRESQPKQYLPVLVIVLILLDEGSGMNDLQSELQSSKAVLTC